MTNVGYSQYHARFAFTMNDAFNVLEEVLKDFKPDAATSEKFMELTRNWNGDHAHVLGMLLISFLDVYGVTPERLSGIRLEFSDGMAHVAFGCDCTDSDS